MLVLIPLLLFLSASFSGSETAIFSLSKLHLSKLAARNRKLLCAVENPDGLLFTILLGNTFVNFLTASLITTHLAKTLGGWAVPVATTLATVLILLLGEILPKSYAVSNPHAIIKYFFPVVHAFYILLYPVSKIFGSIMKEENGHQEAEDIEESDSNFVNGVDLLRVLTCAEVSTPRKDIKAVSEEILKSTPTTIPNHRRIPVFKRSKDHINGYAYFSEIIAFRKKKLSKLKVHKKFDFAVFSEKLTDSLKKLENNEMIVVLDEFGGTQGLIVPADILEIFKPVKKTSILPASTEIWKAERILGVELPQEYDTLLELFTEKDTYKAGATTLKAVRDENGKIIWVLIR